MTKIVENDLTILFHDDWQWKVVKWDESSAHRGGPLRIASVQAVDVVGISHLRKCCLLLELEDDRAKTLRERAAEKSSKRAKESRKQNPRRRPKLSAATGAPEMPQPGDQLERRAIELAQKVVGTLAGLVGDHRERHNEIELQALHSLADANYKLHVVLWSEGGLFDSDVSPRASFYMQTLNRKLKDKLKWLTNESEIYAMSSESNAAVMKRLGFAVHPEEIFQPD